ncbi:hypothetical protein BV22DRAFT_1036594 [Leucogyrophana mollusca]|uniref:Uncharacterized protein n=1 Tax=Leucogyrophana mollusca TaxID=85980 RepID=A0ACB8BC53_9AGAM|nr:hypothetical protein BV22DRAFT_1036594 [Leucogyrophana mollusca]
MGLSAAKESNSPRFKNLTCASVVMCHSRALAFASASGVLTLGSQPRLVVAKRFCGHSRVGRVWWMMDYCEWNV